MKNSHITQAQKGRAYLYVPAEYRDELNITVDSQVKVSLEDGKLIYSFPE